MAKKTSSKAKENSVAANVEVGGNVGGSVIIGHGNIINMPSEQIRLNSLYQLPRPPADFMGRESILADLLKDFESHKGATISGLTGMGGIGKTTLGLEAAHKLTEKYPDAQIFLDLKGTTEPLSALDIARHVVLSFEPSADLRNLDESNMRATYQSILHQKKALLFFDNARSATQIAPLTPPDSCALLVTSRWIFAVPGLSAHKVGTLNEQEAVDFLCELCPRAENHAKELAKACGYFPLALRIAGSFLQVNDAWSVEKYLTRLSDRKNRLTTLTQSHDEAELQTTEPDLLATFELSYNQLTAEDRQRWRRLGVFPASFDRIAAGALWNAEEDETTKLLGILRRYSLLDYDDTTLRYNLHDLLVDFALSQMDGEEVEAVRIAHAGYYANFLKQIDELFTKGGENILAALKLYDMDWLNIDVGQRNSALLLEVHQAAAEACNVYAMQSNIYVLRLTPGDRIKWLESGIRAARVLNDREAEGLALGNLGEAYFELGEPRKAIEFYEQGLSIAREIGDRRNEGSTLGNLAMAYSILGEPRKAIEFYEQGLSIAREIGDRRNEGVALDYLGSAYSRLGEPRKTIELLEQAVSIAREIGDRRNEGVALSSLGGAYSRLGEPRKTIELLEQAVSILREIGDRRNEGVALGSLGYAYSELGESRKTIEFYEQALSISREIGDRLSEGYALYYLGLAFYALDEKERAVDLVKQALKMYEGLESPKEERARNKLEEWGVLE
jgi:tetratricopeptide (TPR) repeat protein